MMMAHNSPGSGLAAALERLDNTLGVTGNEEEVAEVLAGEMEGLADERFTDPLGNQYYLKRGRDAGETLVLAAHMDEIGFIIKYIDDEGFARICPVGYHDDRMVVNQDLVFTTSEGAKVRGVTGAKPFHMMKSEEMEKVLRIDELFVDFGTESRGETLALGLNIGDYGAYSREGGFLNGTDYYTGKSVDDRAGLAVLVETMRRLKDETPPFSVCVVGTTQEETGMRAGGPVASRLRPAEFIAVDVTLTGGTPGIASSDCPVKMGGGPGVMFYDWDPALACGNNVPRRLTRAMIATAKRHGIPFQRDVLLGGGTDASYAALAGTGILAGALTIPARYIHTAVGVVKLSDMEHAVSFLLHYLRDWHPA